MFPLALTTDQVLFALGIAMLTLVMLRVTYRRLGKRGRDDGRPIATQPRPDKSWGGVQHDAKSLNSAQEVELYELSRDLCAEIDSKLILFQELVRQSEAQAARLEALLQEIERKA